MNLELGKRIASLRRTNKVTQAELAEYLSVQPQTISRWEVEGGMPDISLLPRIATFFGVTLDELFGMTDMERINHLVCKYSVLRDEKSFEEAMRSLEQGIHGLEEEESREEVGRVENELSHATSNRQQLIAWKVHMYIQKSRQAIGEAEKILDALLEEVTGPDNPLYLALRLQKQQFRIQGGEGSAALKKAKDAWEDSGSMEDLYCYMAALTDMDNCENILKLWEQEKVQKLVGEKPASAIPQWLNFFYAAMREKRRDLFETYFAIFKAQEAQIKQVQADAIFSARWNLAELYKALGMEEETKGYKELLLQEIKELPYNEFMKQEYIRRISEL